MPPAKAGDIVYLKGRKFRVSKKPIKKYGLNKTEKKQVDTKIKSAIRKTNSLKYFDSYASDNAVAPQFSSVSNKKEISVIAFSSTTEFAPDGSALKYGPQDYQPLYLSRPFKDTNATAALAEQAMDGQFCLPKQAVTRFSIERVAYTVGHAPGGTPIPSPNMARSLPISYRIIKIGIKAMKGTQNDIDPNLDLFLDSFGQPTGVDQNDFDRLDCRYSPINTRKYVKLMDRYGTINQNNIITPNDYAGQLSNIVQQKTAVVMFISRFRSSLMLGKIPKCFIPTQTPQAQRQPIVTHRGKLFSVIFGTKTVTLY